MNIAQQVRNVLKEATLANYRKTSNQIQELGSHFNEQIFEYRIENPQKFNNLSTPVVDLQVAQALKYDVSIRGDGIAIRIEMYEDENETGYNLYVMPSDQMSGGFFFTYEENPIAVNLMVQALLDTDFKL